MNIKLGDWKRINRKSFTSETQKNKSLLCNENTEKK